MSKNRVEMTAEELEAVRKEQRERKQKQRDRQRTERERQKQIVTEQNDPVKRWERNRVERAEEYAAILQRREENLDDLAWLETYTTLLKTGKEPDVDGMLKVAVSALLNIEQYGYDDHLHCPSDWQPEFQWAYESALRTGQNKEYYEFGVTGLRVPRDLWAAFVELAGAYVSTTKIEKPWVKS